MNELAKTGDPMAEFKDRVLAKLREDIGEMLPDEALAGLVQKAVEDQFFKPRIVEGQYRSDREERPSWFVAEVASLAEPILKATVKEYVAQNKDTIDKAIKEFLDEKSLALMSFAALRDATSTDIMSFANEVVARMQRGY